MNMFTPMESGMKQMSSNWYLSRDGDHVAVELFQRHYSCRNKNRKYRIFCGPGHKIVLISTNGDAMFAWVKCIREDGQTGINCSVFRNESSILSSTLINEAVEVAYGQWGRQRCFTFINANKIASKNPGYCFLKSGWRRCGMSKGGLIIMEYFPK